MLKLKEITESTLYFRCFCNSDGDFLIGKLLRGKIDWFLAHATFQVLLLLLHLPSCILPSILVNEVPSTEWGPDAIGGLEKIPSVPQSV